MQQTDGIIAVCFYAIDPKYFDCKAETYRDCCFQGALRPLTRTTFEKVDETFNPMVMKPFRYCQVIPHNLSFLGEFEGGFFEKKPPSINHVTIFFIQLPFLTKYPPIKHLSRLSP